MPIYEYRCTAGHDHDGYATVELRHESKACPTCGASANKIILHAPKVFGDLEGYESPATGKWIEGRRARLEDLRRSHCRPYEVGERQDAERRRASNEHKLDLAADHAVEQALNELTS